MKLDISDKIIESLVRLHKITFMLIAFLFLGTLVKTSHAQQKSELVILKGKADVEAIFEVTDSKCKWITYKDTETGQYWEITGPQFSLRTVEGKDLDLNEQGTIRVIKDATQIMWEKDFSSLPLTLRQRYSFRKDERTLSIETSLRSRDGTIAINHVGLLEIIVSGEKLRLMGPDYISFPIFGERIFAGLEHPSAQCQVKDDTLSISQPLYKELNEDWLDLPAAVFGSASKEDMALVGDEALRQAFIRYINTIRIKPTDMHVYYNDWWTAPIPNTEAFVLENIDRLKHELYDKTGFFFDSYIVDAGWSDIHSLWEINKNDFPLGFTKIRSKLHDMGSRPGLWTSPSSLYPSTLDNHWLAEAGYEVTPYERLGFNACLTKGGNYQTGYKNAILKHIQNAEMNHIKFDGFIPRCDVENHNHPAGSDSYLPLAEGLLDVFDTFMAFDSTIFLEPTCFWIHASPWWLMHVPSVIGPFGDDSPKGRCPSPDWLEAMTTAREIANLEGRKYFLMPSSALQCFDIVVQSPSAFQNHAVMAIGRGRWFVSCYINPKFMDAEEWQFFADLMIWARHNREWLQEPLPIGGDPGNREAYGYAYRYKTRELYCLRNPWIEEAFITLPDSPMGASLRQVRSLYPRREELANLQVHKPLPAIHLGPYETKFVEVVAVKQSVADEKIHQSQEKSVELFWEPTSAPVINHFVYDDDLQPLGPSWTCPEGDTRETLTFNLEGEIEVKGAKTTKMYILCEGRSVKSAFPRINLSIDGLNPELEISHSVGSFSAGGHTDEDWVWFIAPLSEGKHHLALEISTMTGSANFGVFLQGRVEENSILEPFGPDPGFPLYRPKSRSWSHTLVAPGKIGWSQPTRIARSIDHIEGIYLDVLDWVEATTGYGEVQLNRSIQGQPMVMGGRLFHRGIGTHSYSRIVYRRPPEHNTFVATIGCQQTALAGTVVFVIEGDGKEIYRSPLFKAKSEPVDIEIPIQTYKELALIVEDSGDRINADHGNWANARFLKVSE